MRCDLLMDAETLNIPNESALKRNHIDNRDGSVMNFQFGSSCFWQKKELFAHIHYSHRIRSFIQSQSASWILWNMNFVICSSVVSKCFIRLLRSIIRRMERGTWNMEYWWINVRPDITATWLSDNNKKKHFLLNIFVFEYRSSFVHPCICSSLSLSLVLRSTSKLANQR